MTRLLSLSLFALLFASAPAFAQAHADAMARLVPYNGSYTLTGHSPMDEASYGGTLVVAPILGGHFSEWTWEMTDSEQVGEPVHLRFITTYDMATRQYVVWRFDSREIVSRPAGTGMDTRGTIQFEGDTLLMSWPSVNPDNPSETGLFRNAIRLSPSGMDVETNVERNGSSEIIAIARTHLTRR